MQTEAEHNPETIASSKESEGMFMQFKKNYDALRKQYEDLRKEFDAMNLEKRKLEIQVMNFNSEYYEKEIKRLHKEVEKYQE